MRGKYGKLTTGNKTGGKKMARKYKSKRDREYEKHIEPHIDEIRELRKEGHTIEQIAKKMGISRTTFYGYIKEYEELTEALTRGKYDANYELKKSLFMRAKGFMVTERKERTEYNSAGEIIKQIVEVNERYVYSDTMATKLMENTSNINSDELPQELKDLMEAKEEEIAESE